MSDRKRYRAGLAERKLEDVQRWFKENSPTWEEIQEVRKYMRSQSNLGAIDQVLRATPHGNSKLSESDRMLSDAAFYQTFLPSDGNESALSRLATAATNNAMACFERAGALDSTARAAELNFAAKLCRVVAALSKALDSHRGRDWPDFIDDFVANPGNRAA